nr:MAG TPA: hypothetical protein [Siphovirus LN-2020-2]
MICEKDFESGKAFWVAAIASRLVLPNGEEAERKTYEPNGWYLLGADDEYWLYFVEDIQHVNYTMGSRMVAYPMKEPYAIYDKSKYEYELKDNSIVISEKKTLVQKFLKVTWRGRAGVEEVLNGLEEILESFDEKKLTTLQYELDMFREDFDDFLTPEQVEWFDRLYDIVASELDARWLLKKLEEYNIVKIERSS